VEVGVGQGNIVQYKVGVMSSMLWVLQCTCFSIIDFLGRV